MTTSVLYASLPLLIVAFTAIVVMLGIGVRRNHRAAAAISFVGLTLAFGSLWTASAATPVQITSLLTIDRYALLYMGLVLAASAAVVLLSFSYLEVRPEHKEEFYLLLLLATVGSMVLTASGHMASFFLGLELLSISLYALIS